MNTGAAIDTGFEIMDNKKFCNIISTNENKSIIAKICTCISILLLTYSVLTIKLSFGTFGLIHSFPLTFFVALTLLVVCSVILWDNPEKNDRIITVQFIFFLVGLWLVPFVIELTPSRTSYTCAGFVEYIVRHGVLNQEVAFYHNWPAHSILYAVLVNLLDVTDLNILMGLTPFFSNIFYFLALCLLRRFMSKQGLTSMWWPLVWIFFIANYLGQDYFAPQGLAYFFFLLFIGLLLLSYDENSYANKPSGKAMKLLLFCSITIAHALTTLIAGLTIFVLTFRRKERLNSLFVLGVVIFITWTLYGAIVYFSGHIQGFLDEAFNLEISFNQNIARVGTTGDEQVDQVSLYYTLLLLVTSSIGWLTTRQGLLKNIFTKLSIVPLFLPFFVSYCGEMLVRVLLFLLLPIAFFSSSFFINKKRLVSYGFIIFLIISIPLHIISHYGNEEYNYVSSAEQDAARFLFEKVDGKFEIVSENDPVFRQLDLERFVVVLTSTSTLKEGKIIGHWSRYKNDPQYAVISRGTWVSYNRFKTDVDLNKLRNLESFLQVSTNYENIYTNNDSSIYVFREV